MAFNAGETVGDYQVIAKLGAGGMGQVYKVRNVISDRFEAMKVLLPDLATDADLADRFVREIKLVASLDHPNIASLHTAMRVGNQLVMVMEFVEGQTLEGMLKGGPLPPKLVVDCIRQALAALSYAHEMGVIHRDIKPGNMMLTPGGQLKLMDFGIAKAMADRRLTMTGTTLGSLYYMSPEQVKGSSEIDSRSDLYSVGVSLYELVTGKRPFQGDSDYSIMVSHLEATPIAPIQLDPKLPAALSEIIMTAIEKDPANRFQSAKAFGAALESVVSSLPEAARAASASPAPAPASQAETVTARPIPVAPQFAAEPQPVPVAAAPQPTGHRGLWMAAGGLVVVAVLVLVAIEGPRWYRARAGGTAVPVQQIVAPTTPAPPPQQRAAEPVPSVPQTTPPVAAAPEAPAKPSKEPVRKAQAMERVPAAAPAEPIPPQPSAAPAPPVPAVDAGALEKAQERLSRLQARSSAVRGTLERLEQQQKSQGVGMRSDIAASCTRMESLLDEAGAAIQGGDPARANSKLDQAEQEADKLERFLGL